MAAFKAKIERAWKRTPSWLYAIVLMLIMTGLVWLPEFVIRPRSIPKKIVYDAQNDSFEVISRKNSWWDTERIPATIGFIEEHNLRFYIDSRNYFTIDPKHIEYQPVHTLNPTKRKNSIQISGNWNTPISIQQQDGEWVVDRRRSQVTLKVERNGTDGPWVVSPVAMELTTYAYDKWGGKRSYNCQVQNANAHQGVMFCGYGGNYKFSRPKWVIQRLAYQCKAQLIEFLRLP